MAPSLPVVARVPHTVKPPARYPHCGSKRLLRKGKLHIGPSAAREFELHNKVGYRQRVFNEFGARPLLRSVQSVFSGKRWPCSRVAEVLHAYEAKVLITNCGADFLRFG